MTAEELLATMAEPLAEDDGYCTIDPETRVITIPPEYQLLGVESDEKAERIYFKCPKIVGDDIDLSKLALRVNFRNAGQVVDQYLVDDVAVDGDNITFSWLLSRRVTQYEGDVNFIVCAVRISGETITNEWNTTLATAQVLEGLEAEIVLPEEETDIVNQLLSLAETRLNDVKKATADANTAASNANQKAQEAENAAEDARGVTEQITKDSYLHTALQSFIDTVTASPTAYGNAIAKKIEGFTRQQTTTGAQLFDIEGTVTANQATKAILNDGRDLQVTGKKIDSSKWGYAYYSFPVEKVSGKTLYVYVEYNSGLGCEFNIKDAENKWTYPMVSSGTWTTISVPSNVMQCRILFYPNRTTETEVTGVYKNIKVGFAQFETWEPYTGGQPAPNPDYPQVIHGVGDMGFFDGELTQSVYRIADGASTGYDDRYISNANKIPCKSGDTVKMKYDGENVNLYLLFYKSDGTLISTKLAQNGHEVSQVAPVETAYCNFNIYNGGTAIPVDSAGNITVLINGKYAVTVKSDGTNLFNPYGKIIGSYGKADVYGDSIQVTTQDEHSNPGVFCYLGPISRFLGKKLWIKADKMTSSHSSGCRMILRGVNGRSSVQSYKTYNDDMAGTWSLSGEIAIGANQTITDLVLLLYVGDGALQIPKGQTAIFENVMVCLEEGNDTYIPYQSNITYIPVDYPLFEGDKIIQRNGEYKLVRKWGVQIDDGTNAWNKSSPSDNSDYMYYRNTEPDKDATKLIYCNRLKRVANAEKSVGISLSSLYPRAIYVRLDADILPINDVGHFNQWLSDNPLTIVYPMETPIEEPLSPEAVKALNSIMATDEQTELTIIGIPADAEISNQFLLPRNEDGALNTTAYCTAEKNKIVLNELVAQNLDARVNKLEIDNATLAEQTIVVE